MSWRGLATYLATLILLASLVGCSDTTSTGDSGDDPGGSETFSDPSGEPTGPEQPQTNRNQPAIEIASLPVGGNVRTDGITQCAEVNWLGKSPIPDGATVSVTAVGLDPDGVFRLDQRACDSDGRRCVGVRWRSDRLSRCFVGVRQVAAGDGDVQLIVTGVATCRRQSDCDNLVEPGDGSQIAFTPADVEPSTEPSSETPAGG